jgi:hypothetical protein
MFSELAVVGLKAVYWKDWIACVGMALSGIRVALTLVILLVHVRKIRAVRLPDLEEAHPTSGTGPGSTSYGTFQPPTETAPSLSSKERKIKFWECVKVDPLEVLTQSRSSGNFFGPVVIEKFSVSLSCVSVWPFCYL